MSRASYTADPFAPTTTISCNVLLSSPPQSPKLSIDGFSSLRGRLRQNLSVFPRHSCLWQAFLATVRKLSARATGTRGNNCNSLSLLFSIHLRGMCLSALLLLEQVSFLPSKVPPGCYLFISLLRPYFCAI